MLKWLRTRLSARLRDYAGQGKLPATHLILALLGLAAALILGVRAALWLAGI